MTVGQILFIHEYNNPDYLPAGHQRNGLSQMSQSVNGPNTYDEALEYFEFPVEERRRISGDPSYGLSPNVQGLPANLPHLFHLPPQGCSTQTIYHNHSQNYPTTRAIAATPHQGKRYSRVSRRPFSTSF